MGSFLGMKGKDNCTDLTNTGDCADTDQLYRFFSFPGNNPWPEKCKTEINFTFCLFPHASGKEFTLVDFHIVDFHIYVVNTSLLPLLYSLGILIPWLMAWLEI